jgi:hypothetical protein
LLQIRIYSFSSSRGTLEHLHVTRKTPSIAFYSVVDLESAINTEFIGTSAAYLYITFHMPNPTDLLINSIKPKAKHKLGSVTIMLHICQDLLLFTISGPYIKWH